MRSVEKILSEAAMYRICFRILLVFNYTRSAPLGSGSFATVWMGCHVETLEQVAVKEIDMTKLGNNKKLLASLDSEIDILRRTNHPNIIRLINIIKVNTRSLPYKQR